MVQLVSSRLVIHSAHAVRLAAPAASTASSAIASSSSAAARAFISTSTIRRSFLRHDALVGRAAASNSSSILSASAQARASLASPSRIERRRSSSTSTLTPAFFPTSRICLQDRPGQDGHQSSDPSGAAVSATLLATRGATTAVTSAGAAQDAGWQSHPSSSTASRSSTSASTATASPTDKSQGKSVYAPASDDPSLVETDLPGTSQSSPSSTTTAAAAWRPAPTYTLSTLLRTYQQLSKARLTFLVVLTAMAPYALCPSAIATSIPAGWVGGVGTLLALSAGTALCSASANAFNQLLEIPYDAQMARTRARPLPRRGLSSLHAFGFALGCGVGGVGLLYAAVNPLTAALGLGNVLLYAGVYTPLKRLSMVNTWVGSAVGAIPPLMGWVACTGTLFNFPSDAPGWVLAALLFAWQFPHFNSLAHSLRAEYARGGYRMMSVLDPGLNRRVGLRYALLLLPLCSIALPLAGIEWGSLPSFGGSSSGGSGGLDFLASLPAAAKASASTVVEPLPYALLSAPINAVMIHAAYKFWRQGTDRSARWCFWVSLVHLPAVMLLAMVCKRDLWNGVGEALGLETTRMPAVPAGAISASSPRSSARSSDSGDREAERANLERLDGDRRHGSPA